MSICLSASDPDGIDCETCGRSYDEGYIEYDGDNNEWVFEGSWGCYGGTGFNGTRQEMIKWLGGEFRQDWGHLFTAQSISDAIGALEAA